MGEEQMGEGLRASESRREGSARNERELRSAGESNRLTVTGALNREQRYTDLVLPDGREVRVPTASLMQASEASSQPATSAGVMVGGAADTQPDSFVIPLIEETLEVGKRTIATGTVRLRKTVQEYQEALNESLAVRTYDVERVILDRAVEHVPAVRQEGDTTIYPLVEERLVLTKQLILKEEVRVTKRDTERLDTQVVTLQREHMTVERTPHAGERTPGGGDRDR